MSYPNLFKGIIAFIITLAVGLSAAYITGNFKPLFNYKEKKESKRFWRGEAKQKIWQLSSEIEQLTLENERLKAEIEEFKNHPHWENHSKFEHHDLLQRVEVTEAEKQAKRQAEKEIERWKLKRADGVGGTR